MRVNAMDVGEIARVMSANYVCKIEEAREAEVTGRATVGQVFAEGWRMHIYRARGW